MPQPYNDTGWEVRTPLRYGSKSHSIWRDEATARAQAEKVAREEYDGAGLQIHTAKRIIYVDHDDSC